MKYNFAAMAFTAATVLATATWAADPPKNHNNSGMRDACASDIATHCAGVAQGQATMQCVMKNRDKMSDTCKGAMAAMRGNGQGQMNGNPGGGMKGMKEKEMGAGKEKMMDAAKDKAKEKAPM